MHVPDGYLSPSTCAVMYAAAVPFWSVAMRRVRTLYAARYMPLIALAAAFSFVISMFNLPLPGGTTGHAMGVAIAAIVVGPWGAIVALSVTLAIQALFFGDGGLLALGANCVNIAIAGPLVATLFYRAAAFRSAATSRRRVFAAALAGYVAVNVSALLTAIELGVQPLLFTDAGGAPLYAPYPLRIAVPAMMLGHVTIAGIAEAMLTAGIVAYLQIARPSLLAPTSASSTTRSILRPAFAVLALLMLLSPIGLIATGTSWGEWSVEQWNGDRAAIAAASRGAAPPTLAPRGIAKWSEFWQAPLGDYLPSLAGSASAGYIVSAAFGTGVILALFLLVDARIARRRQETRSIVVT